MAHKGHNSSFKAAIKVPMEGNKLGMVVLGVDMVVISNTMGDMITLDSNPMEEFTPTGEIWDITIQWIHGIRGRLKIISPITSGTLTPSNNRRAGKVCMTMFHRSLTHNIIMAIASSKA